MSNQSNAMRSLTLAEQKAVDALVARNAVSAARALGLGCRPSDVHDIITKHAVVANR